MGSMTCTPATCARLAALLLGIVIGPGVAAVDAPFVPADDAEILIKLTESTARPLAVPRALSPDVAAQLARIYLERGRRTQDPRDNGRARGVLRPWWNLPDPPDEVLLLRATLRQADHDFPGALGDLDRLLARRPDDAQAWLTRATVLRVMGRYPEARKACHELEGRASEFVATLCTAAVRGLNGELEAAIAMMETLGPQAAAQPESVAAWFVAERADMATRQGDTAGARHIYAQGVANHPQDVDLRASFADLLLDQHDPAAVLDLIDPDVAADSLRLRRALALHALHDPRFAALDAALGETFEIAQRRGEALHAREEARYWLATRRSPARALKLAMANWQVQREPWDARVLLWAARDADDAEVADPLREWLRVSRLQDARLDGLR